MNQPPKTVERDVDRSGTEPVAASEPGTQGASETIPPRPTRRHLRWGLLAVTTAAVCVGLASYSGVGKSIWGEDPPAPTGSADDPVVAPAPSDDADKNTAKETPEERAQRRREAALGRWRTYYKGDRFMTVRPDGTATIEANLVEYTWLEKKVVGTDRVIFEIEWEIDGDDLVFDTVGGTPKASVDVITTIHGKAKRYPLVHVTETELRYQSDTPEEDDYVWTRMADE